MIQKHYFCCQDQSQRILQVDILLKLLKFGLVGLSGMLIDFGITYLFKERLHLHKYIANAAGFMLAATNNFYWNKVWTFVNDDPSFVPQYAKFIAIALVGLIINTGVLMLVEKRMRINFYLAKVVAITVVVIWNFSMNYLFTF